MTPGENIQAIVANSPEGTRFHLQPGIYRQQTIYPKNRQELVGQEGVILSGAMELTTWKKWNGLWRTQNELPPPLPSENACESGRDLCHLREDLFFNDRLYERVGSLDELGSGAWLYRDGYAYLADDPTGQFVELGVTPLAIGGNADDVLLKDLIVEKYASLAQRGAIEFYDGRGWVLSNVTARWNHGVGLFFGSDTLVQGGSFSHNGQLGVAGTGEDAVVDGAEIAFNNYAGYSARWEAGGTKFHRSAGLVVRNSCIHHNDGPGLWTDIDNVGTIYEGNIVYSNTGDGIKHEISYDADIRNNIVAHNGAGHDVWLWGSQILIQNSQQVNVYGNRVEVSPDFGNGIGVIHQNRGVGGYGPWRAVENMVYDNTITYIGDKGTTGIVIDTDDDGFWEESGNHFDQNTYVVADEAGAHWSTGGEDGSWDDFRTRGHEPRGELIVEERAATKFSCRS